MPELPEVETTKEGIRGHLENQTIAGVIVRNPRLRLPVVANINDLCIHQKIHIVSRRAKYILIKLDTGYLIIHLGMSGHVRLVPANTPPGKHDHLDLCLQNKLVLRYSDPRRFGLFHYSAEDPQEQFFKHLGPEPLSDEFNADYLYQKSRHKNQAIKSFIMTNEIVVGVGNIYATESLFLSGIHPKKPTKTLNYEQCKHLCQQIKAILYAAIQAGGTTLKDFYSFDGKPGYFSISLKAYGRKNLPCLQCKTPIETQMIAGRASAFCPQCQPMIS
ncbi:bifunctional DNA-formamidopyrimidine glycosylase/DNA-(apurinic or apyrimidinic site) lyase [Legionella sp. km772]|uniref:bifunctional DNA-formamidopyrimidine glycosylase/DNA-(apurinic or apyrimidinic site) lyase n=1 Tax=Legionella sp. km772 TaxID=2498111 RepID=UPI000F8D381C|nr:bifunctional DNA-formamidopyrimidine glycosylase/DNA-(apurinic or apyrimidinic site) lyase [Legionella sp. km772]RUR13016.1 bifunctional DNA-formamidopyrimidine glycosylase/DNA-(apurinic or apyrimidinic site) lyase [Legionella sp. km772]